MRKLVNMRLDTELLARVDSVCGPRGRTGFVERALEAALSEAKGPLAARQAGPSPVSLVEDVRPAAPPQDSSGVRDESAGAAAPVARVVAPAGSSPARPPRPVPSVRRAREFVLDPRQAALNKAKKT